MISGNYLSNPSLLTCFALDRDVLQLRQVARASPLRSELGGG